MTTEEILKLMGLGPTPSDREKEKQFNVCWIALLASKPAIREREQITPHQREFQESHAQRLFGGNEKHMSTIKDQYPIRRYDRRPMLILQFVALGLALYLYAAWMAFQARNPTANEMAFWMHLDSVVMLKRLPQYQTP